MLRLQKIISEAGLASRHQAERLIKKGLVTVNGSQVKELGTKADPLKDRIKIKGKLIKSSPIPKIYLLLYKPKGYVTSLKDPQQRPLVVNLLQKKDRAHLYPVGRLDYDTEGILLFTNNGQLAQQLLHPRYQIPRTYLVKIKGVLKEKEIKRLKRGMVIGGSFTLPAKVEKGHLTAKNSWIKITLREGKNRQIKKMCFNLGHPVLKLKRIKYSFLDLKGLRPGEFRYLSPKEVSRLRSLVREREKKHLLSKQQ